MSKQWLAVGVLLTGAYASNATAQEFTDELKWGVRVGMAEYDLPGTNSDPGIAGGFRIGYDFLDLEVVDVGVEGELTTSIIDGEIGNVDSDFESIGAYASVRTKGEVYLIGRAGVVSGEVADEDDTSGAWGVGVGFTALDLNWEAEYTAYEVEDIGVDFFSLGLRF